jgi:MYXO-CTERM domain-containing protein
MNRGAEMLEDVSMTLRELRYTRLVVVALLVGLMTLTVTPMSLAQAPGTPQGGTPPTTAPGESPRTGMAGDRMDNRDDGSGKWGLLGLVGLLGLAGLMRRHPTPQLETTRERGRRP